MTEAQEEHYRKVFLVTIYYLDRLREEGFIAGGQARTKPKGFDDALGYIEDGFIVTEPDINIYFATVNQAPETRELLAKLIMKVQTTNYFKHKIKYA